MSIGVRFISMDQVGPTPGPLSAPTAPVEQCPYVGRLAPSPTGWVHLGIARTSLAAWLDARAHRGRLLLRIEDIDGPRVLPGAADQLQRDFEWLGLDWDDKVVYQSQRFELYQAHLESLKSKNMAFPCTCSRKEIALTASAPHGPDDDGPRYPGTCRDQFRPKPDRRPAWRFRTEPQTITHHDRLLGRVEQDVHATVGDFVLLRTDGLWAYQMAVTVDDLLQGVTCVVRGADLASSTPRQLLLRQQLGQQQPLQTLHLPLVRNPNGTRLAKRDGAAAIAQLRAAGVPAERIIGVLAHSLGLLARPEPLRPKELIDRWSTNQLSRADVQLDPATLFET